MTEPTKPPRIEDGVTFSLTLDTIIGTETERDTDGDFAGTHPITLGETIASAVADQLARTIYREHGRSYLNTLADVVQAQADKIVAEKITAMLEQPIKQTNSYGERNGEPKTLTEIIVERAEKWLGETCKKDQGYGSTKRSNLSFLLDEALGRVFENEITKVIKDAKQKAVEAVAQQAATAMAKAMGQPVASVVSP